MATTGTLIAELVNGLRDSAGAVVASGVCRFYQPGTLTPATVYSDSACSSAVTQPLVLDAGGRGVVYFLNPARMIAKEATDTTTIRDVTILTRAEQVYVTNAGYNSGAETDLNTILTNASTSFGGAGFEYKESSGATARSYTAALGERVVSVKDFGATGDGTTNDTTNVQAAITRVQARGGGIVLFPYGTYLISSPLTITAVGVSLQGTGWGSIIKNQSTTGNAISVDVGSAIDSKGAIRNLAITASTTSTGTAIVLTNGNKHRIENVTTSLHRFGVTASAVSDTIVEGVEVLSTDSNSAAIAFTCGGGMRLANCTAAGTGGTGVSVAGADCALRSVTVGSGYLTGYSIGGARCLVDGGSCAASTSALAVGGGTGTEFRLNGTSFTGTGTVVVTGANSVLSNIHSLAAVTFSGNYCRMIGGYVNVSGTAVTLSALYGVVSGATLRGTTSAVNVTASNATITGNYCVATTTGITLGSTLCTASGNNINAATGINASSANCTVTGNYITATTAGVTASGASVAVVGNIVAATTTGISLTGATTSATSNSVSGATTGISVATGAKIRVIGNDISGATTGISIGAVTSPLVHGNIGSSNTTDLSVNISAVTPVIGDNVFSTFADACVDPLGFQMRTGYDQQVAVGQAAYTFTPDLPVGGETFYQCLLNTYNAGTQTITVASTGTTGLVPGALLHLTFINQGASVTQNHTWNTIYKGFDGSAVPSMSIVGAGNVAACFRWNGTNWILMTSSHGTSTA